MGKPQAPKELARLTSRSEEGGGRVGELLASGQGPIGPWKAGQEVVPKVKLVGVALHLFLVSQDHVSHTHVHGTPLPWFLPPQKNNQREREGKNVHLSPTPGLALHPDLLYNISFYHPYTEG